MKELDVHGKDVTNQIVNAEGFGLLLYKGNEARRHVTPASLAGSPKSKAPDVSGSPSQLSPLSLDSSVFGQQVLERSGLHSLHRSLLKDLSTQGNRERVSPRRST